jgi:transposase-like protein
VVADALTMKVREGGRVINAVVLATGVNGHGHREVLGMRIATSGKRVRRGTSSSPISSPAA